MDTDLLRRLCKERGTSLTKAEAALGFGNGTIGKWAKSTPSFERVQMLADYLGVSTDYLMGHGEQAPASVEHKITVDDCIEASNSWTFEEKEKLFKHLMAEKWSDDEIMQIIQTLISEARKK